MKRVIEEQRLGFVATVCRDGTPNLSPKGTTAVWDDDHLVFANIRSPQTIENLRKNPSVEVNVVDPFARKGYRFKGAASILESGALYDKAVAFYEERGSRVSMIREIVLIEVVRAQYIDSPAYDLGMTEDEVRDRWEVMQWVMTQMGHVGPMLGQAHHFRIYAPEKIEYAINRYTNEARRLYGVMDKRLANSKYIAGPEYSIADIAIFPWLRSWKNQGIDWNDYPHLKGWFDEIAARPAVQRGVEVLAARRRPITDERAREVLFGSEQYKRH